MSRLRNPQSTVKRCYADKSEEMERMEEQHCQVEDGDSMQENESQSDNYDDLELYEARFQSALNEYGIARGGEDEMLAWLSVQSAKNDLDLAYSKEMGRVFNKLQEEAQYIKSLKTVV